MTGRTRIIITIIIIIIISSLNSIVALYSCGVCDGVCAELAIPIETPFGDIAVHVIEPPGVGQIITDFDMI